MHFDREMAPVTCQTWAVWLKVPERKKKTRSRQRAGAPESRAPATSALPFVGALSLHVDPLLFILTSRLSFGIRYQKEGSTCCSAFHVLCFEKKKKTEERTDRAFIQPTILASAFFLPSIKSWFSSH